MASPISKMIDLSGQVALITGSSGGIGQEICRRLEKSKIGGLALVDRNDMPFVPKHRGDDTIIKYWNCDVSDRKQVKSVVKDAISIFKRIDILITCAGIASESILDEITEEEWDLVLNVNLKGTFFFIQEIYPHMAKQRYGKILCIGSLAARRPGQVGGLPYVASKGGIHAMVKRLAFDGAEDSIYVNAIAPGPIVKTEMWDNVASKLRIEEKDVCPLMRFGYPEDIAEAAIFLVSSASNWITGVILDVNGGIYMG
jgi:3-oxoacyl-[acyl-carrier protein] reductase